MNKKGFNMFSAIVSVLLIMIVSVLIGTLVMSEERTSTQIYSMFNNYKLSDAANLARADALQTFNYAFREKMENYLAYYGSKLNDSGIGLFIIKKDSKEVTFDQLQKKFEENILKYEKDAVSDKNELASILHYVAENTINNFTSWTYGKYSVELDNENVESRKALYDALMIVVNRTGEEESFLEVIDCTEHSCPKGTFYFKINLSKLSDREYELLPKMIVKDTFTQEQIKTAILPRSDLMVYVPIRFFKVLYESMKAENALRAAHEKNAQFRLGFCDDACAPRTDPLNPRTGNWNNNCPLVQEKSSVSLTKKVAGIDSYFSGGDSAGATGLWGYGAEEVCDKSIGLKVFEVESDKDNFYVWPYDLGLGAQRKEVIGECGYDYLAITTIAEPSAIVNDNADQKLYCGRIYGVVADIIFVDSNPKYLVKGTSIVNGRKSNQYKIRIEDDSFDELVKKSNEEINLYCSSGEGMCNKVN